MTAAVSRTATQILRVVFGKHDGSHSVALNGSRVMLVGPSLLVDGRRIARKRTWSGRGADQWIDEFGRAWDTIDFLTAAPAADAEDG